VVVGGSVVCGSGPRSVGGVLEKKPLGHFSGKFLNKKLRKVGDWVWWAGWSLVGCWRAGGGSGWCWRRQLVVAGPRWWSAVWRGVVWRDTRPVVVVGGMAWRGVACRGVLKNTSWALFWQIS